MNQWKFHKVLVLFRLITARNEVGVRLCFLHVSLIPFTWGSAPVHAGIHPPGRPPWADTPLGQTPPPPGQTPPGRHPLDNTPLDRHNFYLPNFITSILNFDIEKRANKHEIQPLH